MFRDRYYLSPLRRERSPCILLLLERVRSGINPFPCSTFSQLAKSSDHSKREFQAICDSLPPPHRTHAVFRERGQSLLDQSNLFLTYFHSQGLLFFWGGGELNLCALVLGENSRCALEGCRRGESTSLGAPSLPRVHRLERQSLK